MPSFENYSQNVPLPARKLGCGTIFRQVLHETWQECFYTTRYALYPISTAHNLYICLEPIFTLLGNPHVLPLPLTPDHFRATDRVISAKREERESTTEKDPKMIIAIEIDEGDL